MKVAVVMVKKIQGGTLQESKGMGSNVERASGRGESA